MNKENSQDARDYNSAFEIAELFEEPEDETLARCTDRAREILAAVRDSVEALANVLRTRRPLTYSEITNLVPDVCCANR